MKTDLQQNLAANPQEDLLRLRKRLIDLQRTGMFGPEGFATYQQTILQVWQEAEKYRNTLLEQAQTLRAQSMQAEAQSHAFSIIGSILYSVINGYVEIENKRLAEEQERLRQKAAEAAEEAAAEAAPAKPTSSIPPPMENQSPVESGEAPKSAGKRRKRDDGDQQS